MANSVARILAIALLLGGSAAAHAENLQDVYKLALQSDPQLRAAEQAHLAALQAKPLSRAGLLPQLNFTAQTQWNETDIKKASVAAIPTGTKQYNSSSYSLSLTQVLYNHATFVKLKQADASIAQADAQYGSAQQDVIVRVAQAYFNLLAAQDRLDFAQAEQRAIAQQLKQAQQRFEVGLSAITDVREAQAGFDGAVAQGIVAQNQVDTAHEALREITGQDDRNLAVVPSDIPLATPNPDNIDKWVATAQQQNLQLLASEAAVEVARQQMSLAEAGHYPSLDIVGSHNHSDTLQSPSFGTQTDSNVIALQLNVPIFAGGAVSAQARQSTYLYSQAQDSEDQTRRAVVRSTRDAFMGVTAGISTVQARKQALISAQTALEATQAGFKVGTRTALDVLNAQQTLFGAQRDYAQSRYDYIMATLKLKQAAGILSAADVTQINSWLH